jgi:hypothetical protein
LTRQSGTESFVGANRAVVAEPLSGSAPGGKLLERIDLPTFDRFAKNVLLRFLVPTVFGTD